MKKLLLLFTMALVSIGSQASMPTPPGGDDFTWQSEDYYVDLTVTNADPHQNKPPYETLTVNPAGSLAAWVAYVTSEDFTNTIGDGPDGNKPFMGLGAREPQSAQGPRVLKINGLLNADDLAALASLPGFSNYISIDMTGVSLAGGATADNVLNTIDFGPKSWEKPKPGNQTETVNGVGAQYIALPYGVTSVADMTKLTENGKNSTLTVAGTYAATSTEGNTYANKSEFAAYSFVKGNMNGFLSSLFPEISDGSEDNIQKLSLGGQIAVNDISQGNGGTVKLFRSENLHEMDLLYCTFEECQITVPEQYGQGYYSKKKTVTTPCGDSVDHDVVTRWPGETITSNALYYLRNYSLETCVLPQGNTEIPPQTFANSSGQGPIRNITIPEGYTRIGFEAFFGHDILTLELPSTMQVVEAGAFADRQGVSQLNQVTMKALQGTCTFGEAVFMRNFMLKNVTLSEGVTNIGDHMFDQCYLLESIRIPTTCEVIGERAFYETYELHSVIIPEGVEYVLREAFELGGLTDLYIMARSLETLPKIYSMNPNYDPNNNNGASFTYQRTSGNNTVPAGHLKDTDFTTNNPNHWDVGYDEIITWYQAELSGVHGLGTGNALVALHYPDEMKGFYEGIDVSDFFDTAELDQYIRGWQDSGRNGGSGWLDYANTSFQGNNIQNLARWKVNGIYGENNYNGQNNATGDDILQYLPQAYSVQGLQHEGASPRMGPDVNNAFYPQQIDYMMRFAAGATSANGSGECLSAWGWRQFPLAYSIGDMNKVPFDKLYDDTWYTMCFPWHMTDDQLFEAFNQNMEIVEFVGVEMIEKGDPATNAENHDWTYEMVFHFDDVAVTTYRDNNDVEYSRVRIGHRMINGEDRAVYRYTSKDGNNTVVEYPLEYTADGGGTVNQGVQIGDGSTLELREAYGKYLNIQNILSLAGHPYMIHPSIGASPGNPATVYINATPRTGEQWTPENQAVKKPATIDDQAYGNINDGATAQPNKGGVTEFVNPITNGGGSYTFIGNVGDVSKLTGNNSNEGEGTQTGEGTSTSSQFDEDGNMVMPTPAYFLAVPPTGEYEERPIYENQEQLVWEDEQHTIPVYTYFSQEGGSYNQNVTEAYYEYVGTGGDYTASEWTNANGTGHYNQRTATERGYVIDFNGIYQGFEVSSATNVGKRKGNYNQETYTNPNWSDDPKNGSKYYVYVGVGNGEYNVTFTQSNQYISPAYKEEDITVAYYDLVPEGNGNYEASEYAPYENGEWQYHPEVVEYENVGEGNGSYDRKQKTEIVQVQTGSITVPIYEAYPKFYRKKQTSGNKWSKYSAIIQPDAAAITNIEDYLNYQQASANGYNVSFGEWEEVTTTAIKKIVEEAEQRNEPVQKIHLNVVYNIKGQVVRNGSTSLEGLPKGLYIVNGKKYMVK